MDRPTPTMQIARNCGRYMACSPPTSLLTYLRGMSDLASCILAIMDHEDHTFVCFCGITKCLAVNFYPEGCTMATKFAHLMLLLQQSDPDFCQYVQEAGV